MSVAQTHSTAPIVKIAAGAVIILSAVGVGAMTGLLPGVSSKETAAEPQQVQTAPAERAKPAAVRTQPKPAAQEPVKVASAAPACAACGVVQSIQAVEVQGQASGAGAVIGGVAGLVVGNQIGKGSGKTLAKVAGAAGGAYAGHQVEKNMKKTTEYQVSVRMNDGSYRTFIQPSTDGLVAGMRVKIIGDSVIPE